LHLKVLERRPDGYHSLQSIFAALDLSDELFFALEAREGLCGLETAGSIALCIQPEKNLVFKAVSLFRERTGFTQGVRVRLFKRIPVGGGLGGGSSDAAASLIAMNRLSGLNIPETALKGMASELGSDVPFFITGGTALVSGRGEIVEPVALKRRLWAVLVNPGFESPTAEAFRLLDKQRRENPGGGEPGDSLKILVKALGKEPGNWHFTNDFLPVFLSSGPRDRAETYRNILEDLKKRGADFFGLSGAGSTCFAVFTGEERAEQAVQALKNRWNFVCLTFFLARFVNTVLE
jgi:4-diphosphocytidyl-2-C-methyl-D-erythritol kinase